MLTNALRIAIAVVGAAALLLAARLWFDTAPAAEALGLATRSPVGLATVRADVAGYFIGVGVLLLWSAWRRASWPLSAVLVLLAAALTGRVIGLLIDGGGTGIAAPMIVEAALIALVVVARQRFGAWRG